MTPRKWLRDDKLDRLRNDLSSWETRKSTTIKELQSLIGTLNFACKVVPPGRAFLQYMIQLTRGVTKHHHHIRLNHGFHQDLKMWQTFLQGWNGTNLFLNTTWGNSYTLSLFTDASGTLSFGGIFRNQWFQGSWLPHQSLDAKEISIDWQELFAIIAATYIWGHVWSQKRILFYYNN